MFSIEAENSWVVRVVVLNEVPMQYQLKVLCRKCNENGLFFTHLLCQPFAQSTRNPVDLWLKDTVIF